MVEKLDYFEGYEGAGLDNITPDMEGVAYLGMIQPGSGAALTLPAGTWRNSATAESYGEDVEVVVLDVKTAWIERSKEPPFMTVGRYVPNTVPVKIEQPRPGTRGYPKIINEATSGEINELFVYALIKADAPEKGIMYYSPTVGSMRACKNWNKQLKSQRFPNGKPAPLFGYTWIMKTGLIVNPKKPAEQIAAFLSVTRGNIVPEALFVGTVKPSIDQVHSTALLVAPETSGEVEE